MSNPDRLRDENDDKSRAHAHLDWARIKARALMACDGLKEQMERVTAEPARGDAEELWKALWEYGDLFTEAAILEVEARSANDRLVLDLKSLDSDLEDLEAELFLRYHREMTDVGGRDVTEPTVDAIKAAIVIDEQHQAIVHRRPALVEQIQEAENMLAQMAVTRKAIEQHGEALRRLSANRPAEMVSQMVSHHPSPADSDFSSAKPVKDGSTQMENVEGTQASGRGTLEKSRQQRRARPTSRYIGADSLPQFRRCVHMLRRHALLEERAYELAQLGTDPEIAELRELLAKDAATMFPPPGTLFGDLLLVAVRPTSYADTDMRARQFVEQLLNVRRAGPLLANGMVEFKRSLAGLREVARSRGLASVDGRGNDARLAAADRIVRGLGRAISQARFPYVKPVLGELAELHEGEPDAKMRHALVSVLFEAVEFIGEYTFADEDEIRHKLRKHIKALARVDRLGPGWRHATDGVDIEFDDTRLLPSEHRRGERQPPAPQEVRLEAEEAQAEARLLLERLVADSGLTRTEAEVLRMVADRGGDHGAITAVAHELGKNRSTVGVQYFNAKKKLLAASHR